ncbi:MAG TPA: CPBP family intramembrane glutamic endopeptidase [Thermoanaerobaculia bacterium]|nr:CPBP family intramembrane glutamic endopeptidase [Thermoanaerobaculia bacterium]
MDQVRLLAPLTVAVLTALAFDRAIARRGLQPPGLAVGGVTGWRARRFAATWVLSFAFYLVVYLPLATFGREVELDPARLSSWQLFLGHGVLLGTLVVWCAAGFAGVPQVPARRQAAVWVRQIGLVASRPGVEIMIGLGTGVVAWAVVLGTMLLLTAVLAVLGASELLPQRMPAMVAALGALPVWLRLAISLSAGVAEEVFFRGFLQPRAGVLASTALFVAAHLGYQQPWMLVGVTLLSLFFAALARWRQSVWAAVTAHAVFDAIQLLWLVPLALDASGTPGSPW